MSILCYHAVDPHWKSPLSVTPEEFERHCAWLARELESGSVDTKAVADAVIRAFSHGFNLVSHRIDRTELGLEPHTSANPAIEAAN